MSSVPCRLDSSSSNIFQELKKSGANFLLISAERLTGTEITVCDHIELDCYNCGVTPYADRGEFALVKCEAGAKGSIVKFLTRSNYFQACEIEIYGTPTPKGYFFIISTKNNLFGAPNG